MKGHYFKFLSSLVCLFSVVFSCTTSDTEQNSESFDDNSDTNDEQGFNFKFIEIAQEPIYEKGLIIPPNSLECIPIDTGIPQLNCNHHGSTVAELKDGTIAAVWYHGVKEKSPDAKLVWSKREPGSTKWTWPEVIFDDVGLSEGNPAIWVDEQGTIYVFFVTIFGEGWSQSKIRLIKSYDNGKTWTAPIFLREKYCWMTRHRPLRLANGDLLLPLYNECLAYPVFMRSKDNFNTWTEEAHLSIEFYLQHVGQIQPALALLKNGRISALTRDGTPTRRIKRMISDDNGISWSPSIPTELPNSGTSIDQVVLENGRVVVVYNDSTEDRFPLTVALSYDGGQTFIAKRNINDECDEGSCSYSYPSIIQSRRDGTIWVTYTHNRQTIGWVHFNEAWILEGE